MGGGDGGWAGVEYEWEGGMGVEVDGVGGWGGETGWGWRESGRDGDGG